ncbi:sensor histidine kinase [Bacillus marasmi]|uniref:sensor histidine kinase n=1 Tax=Bacillus marasmi TaxID=1926279 RepID=UPI0011C78674|nr:ATP-binding protein [Bacillus marasmi]
MKLQTKLIIAFIAIVLLMGIGQSIFLQARIEATFNRYLEQYNFGFMERMKQNLELYFEETSSWENVQETYFEGNSGMGQGHGMMMQGMLMNMAMANADLLLLDLDGTVIADTSGTRIGNSGEDVNGKSQEIIIDGELKGTLILYQHKLQNLEKEFIRAANLAIFFSGLAAAALAVLFSILIAKKITKPLRILVTGIRKLGSGEKVNEVRIETEDEFRELGDAFNQMSHHLARNEEIRQTLVADVAHELRTPLAILQGRLESIQEGAIQATEEVILELTDEVYRLNRLVSDLQQLSLAEAGKLPLNKQPVNLKKLIVRVCTHLQWLADEKGITLRFEKIPEDCMVELDGDRMVQVFVNLIGNALRHTQENGVVEITVEITKDIIINVADTGPGIPEDALPYIFDRFYKRDSSRNRNEGGTGLGLSIAKGYVEAHGGTISVNSKMGKGTIFTIELKQ